MKTKQELQLIGGYLWAVCLTWWVVLIEAVLVTTDVAERLFGTWFLPTTRTKIVIGLGVLAIAQYRVYRKRSIELQNLRDAQKARPQPTELTIHEERGSKMYIEHPNIPVRHNYFEFHLTVHNTGPQPSVIRKFDLDVQNQGAFENLEPMRRNMIQTARAQQMTQFNNILDRTYITVPAHETWTGIIMLAVPAMPVEAPPVRCTLKLTDSNATSAAHTFEMAIQD